ncbi:hypothetical protein ACFTXM_09805 [Streptomyces sp. NPDC056930]|uniref:hypothetical protein n=1 Tax=Streptomyces sp. NPDC056930 TaxID=3345967 RepID=UPI003639BD2C
MSDTSTDATSTETTSETGPESGTETTTTETSAETSTETTADGELGDAGKKAIKTERDARKAAEKERDAAQAEIKRLQRSNAAVKGTDLEAIKTEIRAEFAAQLAETAIKSEAKGRLHDPSDALLYIKSAEVNGEDAIKAAVDQLLKDRPYLAAAESGARPWGDVGGGKAPSTEPEPASPQERMRRAYGKAN